MKDLTDQLMKLWRISPFLAIAVLLAGSALAGFVFHAVLTLVQRGKKQQASKYSFVRSVLTHLKRPFSFFLSVVLLDVFLDIMDPQQRLFKPLVKLVDIMLIVGFSWILMAFIKVVQDYVYFKYDLSKADNLRERKVRTQLLYIKQIVVVFIVIITIGAILLSFSAMRRWGAGLLTGVGIGGIIVGFAAQKTLANILAGFQVAFTQPIRIDDVVVVEGQYGNIEEISLTYVVVRIWDKRRLILPITYFIEKPFENWTRTGSAILATVMVYTDYAVPVELVREEFMRLLRANKLWDGQVAALQVTDAREQVLELRALLSANNAGDAFDLRCFIRENLVRFIRDNYPQSFPRLRTEIIPGQEPANAATALKS